MANLTSQEEYADRHHDRQTCWFPENGGCMRHNTNRPGSKTDKQYLDEAHARLAKEVQEINKQADKNLKYSPERGIYL